MASLVWSYGGGVQSVTLAVLILQGRLPVPSVAVLADTGREVQTTFDYMTERVNPALLPFGFQIEIASHDLSTVDLYSKGGKLLMPVYTSHAGSLGRLPTYCSNEWKSGSSRATCASGASEITPSGLASRQTRRTE